MLLALAEKAGQGMASKQLLKIFSCRECQGDVPVNCPATSRCSGLRSETSMSGGPQLMTLPAGTGGGAAGLEPSRENTHLSSSNESLEIVTTMKKAVDVQGRLENNQERLVAAG